MDFKVGDRVQSKDGAYCKAKGTIDIIDHRGICVLDDEQPVRYIYWFNPEDLELIASAEVLAWRGYGRIGYEPEGTTTHRPALIKCECGVDSVGGGNHSTWCPKSH